MSMLPEEFPLVLTVFLAMGAWRISQARVLTRRATAIEALGSATVLCTDKTGTLTENRMTIAELRLATGDGQKLGEITDIFASSFAELVENGVLASAANPFDPMEKAFHALAGQAGASPGADGTLLKAYPLRPDLLAVTHVWRWPGLAQTVSRKWRARSHRRSMPARKRAARGAGGGRRGNGGCGAEGAWRGKGDFGGRTDRPKSQHEFAYEYLGLVASPIPCAKALLRPSPCAGRRESAC